MNYAKPRIALSMCLGISPVRYDGNIIFDPHVEKLKKYVEVISVCPEVGLGLGVPRNPFVLSKRSEGVRLIDVVTGDDYTDRMISFTQIFLGNLPEIDGFILKSASPSCGVGDSKIYSIDRRVLGKTDGLFTSIIKGKMPQIPIESEKRLANNEIRRNFYTKIFTLAHVRESLSKIMDPEELVDLHRGLKYLLMLYHPGVLKKLGRMIANRNKASLEELKKQYKAEVLEAFTRNPTKRSYVSVFLHLYGHVKDKLPLDERRYVLRIIDSLRNERGDINAVLTYFRGFIYRLGEEYLAEQRFLQPYPEELD